jgi:uncharacterized protein YjbI with pentapeptide repeats
MVVMIRLGGLPTLVTATLVLVPVANAQDGPRSALRLDIRGANFREADMSRANLADADVRGALFLRADVSGATFWRARIDGADFRGVRGMTPQQVSSASWNADSPPRLDTALHAFRRFWDKKHLAGKSLRGANWWGKDLSGFDFTGADLGGAVMIAANLRGAALQRANLSGVILQGADLSGADLRSAKGFTAGQLVAAKWDPRRPPLVSSDLHALLKFRAKRRFVGLSISGALLWLTDLTGANLTGADLSKTVLIGASLRDAVLRDANLASAVLTGADLTGADLRGAKGLRASMLYSARWDRKRPPVLDAELLGKRKFFERGHLAGESFDGANLWGANLAGFDFTGSLLRNVVLVDSNLRKASLRDADLTGAILTGADITGADLRSAKGFGVAQLLSARWDAKQPPILGLELAMFAKLWNKRDLSRRNLHGASLWDVDLMGANLRRADLSDVAFVRAQLRGANLTYTDLRGATFLGTDISGTDFRGAKGLTGKMILSAVWDPKTPPIFGPRFHVLRTFAQSKRFEFDLQRACLQGEDPPGVRGLARRDDRLASFSLSRPPRLGMARLIRLIRKRDFAQLTISP